MFPKVFQVPLTEGFIPKTREQHAPHMEVVGSRGLGQKTVVPVWAAWPGDLSRKGPDGRPLNCPGVPQVNEVVFSPSESHCATCGEDGSVRVWSLASMELVIQFQVLNQVGREIWGFGHVLCSLCHLPGEMLVFPSPCDTRVASALRGHPRPVDSQSSSRWWPATAMAHFESLASLVLRWNSRCIRTGRL